MKPPSASTTSATPLLLGKYAVERELGRGGMGVVWAVRHAELGELFALKVMSQKAMEQPGAVDRFLLEARAAARIRSEHAVKVYDVGRLETGQPYMLMQCLEGEDLSTLLGRRGALDANTAARYVAQALEAIEEAHALGIVHRDLKPENLFLTKKPNGEPNIKVLDFGISKDLELSRAGVSTTQSLVGSPLYMSPEQMRAAKDVDTKSDIWSLGIVLFELCTGDVPFPGNNITEVCAQVLSNEPPWERLGHAPAEFVSVVRRCLEKDRERRFGSASEMKATLDGIASREGIYSVRPPAIEPLTRADAATTLALNQAIGDTGRAPRDGRVGGATVQGWDSALRERSTRVWPRVALGMGIGAAIVVLLAVSFGKRLVPPAAKDPSAQVVGAPPTVEAHPIDTVVEPTATATSAANASPTSTSTANANPTATATATAAAAAVAPPRTRGARPAATPTGKTNGSKPQREGIY